jgi:hypothetical protein
MAKIVTAFRLPTKVICLFGVLCFSSPLLVAGTEHPSRISYVDGAVAVAHEGSSEWELLEQNFPIWEGDRISSEGNSRAEIEFNDGTLMRLGSWTGVVFRESSPKKVIVQLLSGDLIVHKKDDRPFRLVSSGSTTDLKDEGVYRFSVLESGETTVRVRRGRARTVQGAVSVSIREGDAWRVGVSGGPLTRLYGSAQRDGFDEWSDLRDALRRGQYPSSLKPYTRYAGSRDLNRYGQWGYVSSYGRVWWPLEKSEWIPYQTGRWVYDPFGQMVWISDEPWGWLPYHYGNWIYISYYSRWCWVPGNFNRWQPALVSFYFGGGYLGWAPKEPKRHASVTGQGRPHGRSGLTLIAGRDLRRKRISPNTIVPKQIDSLRSGLPPGLETDIQSGRYLPAARPAPRKVAASRSALGLLKGSGISSQFNSRTRPTTLVGRGVTSFRRSGPSTLKSKRSSPVPRSRTTRPNSSSGKVKMGRYR